MFRTRRYFAVDVFNVVYYWEIGKTSLTCCRKRHKIGDLIFFFGPTVGSLVGFTFIVLRDTTCISSVKILLFISNVKLHNGSIFFFLNMNVVCATSSLIFAYTAFVHAELYYITAFRINTMGHIDLTRIIYIFHSWY